MATAAETIEKNIVLEIISILEGITFTNPDSNGRTSFQRVTQNKNQKHDKWPHVFVKADDVLTDETCFNRCTNFFPFEVHIFQYYKGVDDPEEVMLDDLRNFRGYVYDTFLDRLVAGSNRDLNSIVDKIRVVRGRPTTEVMEGTGWTIKGHVMIELEASKLM